MQPLFFHIRTKPEQHSPILTHQGYSLSMPLPKYGRVELCECTSMGLILGGSILGTQEKILTGFYCFFPVLLLFSHAEGCFLVWISVYIRKIARYERRSSHIRRMCYATPVRCYFASVFSGFYCTGQFFTVFSPDRMFLARFLVVNRGIPRYKGCSRRI